MADKTERELAAEARKLVTVTGVVTKDDNGEVVEKKEEVEAKTDDNSDAANDADDKSGESGTETVTETKEEIETSEEKQEELETAKAEAKTTAEKARIQRKIDKEVAKRKTLEEELAAVKKELADAKEGKEGKYDDDEVEKRASVKAEAKAAEREFVQASNRLADAAEKIDKDFIKKIKAIAEDVAPIPGHMIGILDDLDNGAAVLANLADDVDEYERIIALNPTKAAVELSKISNKITTGAKPKAKELSKVPDPITPLGGKTSSTSNDLVIRDKEIKDASGALSPDFIRKRAAQIEARNKARAAGYR